MPLTSKTVPTAPSVSAMDELNLDDLFGNGGTGDSLFEDEEFAFDVGDAIFAGGDSSLIDPPIAEASAPAAGVEDPAPAPVEAVTGGETNEKDGLTGGEEKKKQQGDAGSSTTSKRKKKSRKNKGATAAKPLDQKDLPSHPQQPARQVSVEDPTPTRDSSGGSGGGSSIIPSTSKKKKKRSSSVSGNSSKHGTTSISGKANVTTSGARETSGASSAVEKITIKVTSNRIADSGGGVNGIVGTSSSSSTLKSSSANGTNYEAQSNSGGGSGVASSSTSDMADSSVVMNESNVAKVGGSVRRGSGSRKHKKRKDVVIDGDSTAPAVAGAGGTGTKRQSKKKRTSATSSATSAPSIAQSGGVTSGMGHHPQQQQQHSKQQEQHAKQQQHAKQNSYYYGQQQQQQPYQKHTAAPPMTSPRQNMSPPPHAPPHTSQMTSPRGNNAPHRPCPSPTSSIVTSPGGRHIPKQPNIGHSRSSSFSSCGRTTPSQQVRGFSNIQPSPGGYNASPNNGSRRQQQQSQPSSSPTSPMGRQHHLLSQHRRRPSSSDQHHLASPQPKSQQQQLPYVPPYPQQQSQTHDRMQVHSNQYQHSSHPHNPPQSSPPSLQQQPLSPLPSQAQQQQFKKLSHGMARVKRKTTGDVVRPDQNQLQQQTHLGRHGSGSSTNTAGSISMGSANLGISSMLLHSPPSSDTKVSIPQNSISSNGAGQNKQQNKLFKNLQQQQQQPKQQQKQQHKALSQSQSPSEPHITTTETAKAKESITAPTTTSTNNFSISHPSGTTASSSTMSTTTDVANNTHQTVKCGLEPSDTLFYPFMILPTEVGTRRYQRNFPLLDQIYIAAGTFNPKNNKEADAGFFSGDQFQKAQTAMGGIQRHKQMEFIKELRMTWGLLERQNNFLLQNSLNMEQYCKGSFSSKDYQDAYHDEKMNYTGHGAIPQDDGAVEKIKAEVKMKETPSSPVQKKREVCATKPSPPVTSATNKTDSITSTITEINATKKKKVDGKLVVPAIPSSRSDITTETPILSIPSSTATSTLPELVVPPSPSVASTTTPAVAVEKHTPKAPTLPPITSLPPAKPVTTTATTKITIPPMVVPSTIQSSTSATTPATTTTGDPAPDDPAPDPTPAPTTTTTTAPTPVTPPINYGSVTKKLSLKVKIKCDGFKEPTTMVSCSTGSGKQRRHAVSLVACVQPFRKRKSSTTSTDNKDKETSLDDDTTLSNLPLPLQARENFNRQLTLYANEYETKYRKTCDKRKQSIYNRIQNLDHMVLEDHHPTTLTIWHFLEESGYLSSIKKKEEICHAMEDLWQAELPSNMNRNQLPIVKVCVDKEYEKKKQEEEQKDEDRNVALVSPLPDQIDSMSTDASKKERNISSQRSHAPLLFDKLQSLLVEEDSDNDDMCSDDDDFTLSDDDDSTAEGSLFDEDHGLDVGTTRQQHGTLPSASKASFLPPVPDLLDVSDLTLDQRTFIQLRAVQLVDRPLLPTSRPMVEDYDCSNDTNENEDNDDEACTELTIKIKSLQAKLSKLNHINNVQAARLQNTAVKSLSVFDAREKLLDEQASSRAKYHALRQKKKREQKQKEKQKILKKNDGNWVPW